MAIFKASNRQQSLALMSGPPVGRVKTSATRTPTDKVSKADEADYFSTFQDLLELAARRGWSSRMSRASYLQSKEPLLRQLSTSSKRSGIWGGGSRLTLSTRGSHKTAKEYSLLQVISPTVPISSLLTAAACLGIVRREERAGRELDPNFQKALSETLRFWSSVAEASGTPWQKVSAPRFAPKLESIKEVIQTDRYFVARNLTWDECEALMGFPEGWTDAEGDSLAMRSRR